MSMSTYGAVRRSNVIRCAWLTRIVGEKCVVNQDWDGVTDPYVDAWNGVVDMSTYDTDMRRSGGGWTRLTKIGRSTGAG